MLKLSKKSDYGLLIVSKLLHTDEYVSLSKLVEHTKLPLRFLARISAVLARNGILMSREGRVGGYKLGKGFNQFSVYDFLSVFENNLNMTGCQERSEKCAFEHLCKHKESVRCKLHEVILNDLKKVKLSDLFS
ncbi:MAG: Rrf2 family transcriptional regulator [bacterium]